MFESERFIFSSNIHMDMTTPAHTDTHTEPGGIKAFCVAQHLVEDQETIEESIFLFEDLKEPFLENRDKASDVSDLAPFMF